ncbi:MAG: Leucine-, isoleucine-, valine-, threonine-, and alanine-binding protein precursor [Betaproteobacteria bacterium ADurb.Bin341]|nr:MAG: Leucine-, isoleucine-, valine-, threonine-, and alanine-binding protein precursor [Betaproteobacteria bacterium ADurb.Bin341]
MNAFSRKLCWLTALSFLGTAAHVALAAEPIKFGAVVPVKELVGKQSANAMRLAVKEINNAGGVLGRQIKVIIEDDEMNGPKGAAAINKLATEDKVDFFIGGLSSSVTLDEIPVMKLHKKITLWSGAASSRVERALKGEDWFFHLHPWDYQQTQGYIDGWLAIAKNNPKVKLNKWFFAYEDGAFGTRSYHAYVDIFPKEWTHKGADFKSVSVGGNGDYRVVLKRAKEAKPDVFVWFGHEDDALPIMNQAREMGFQPPVFIGSPPGWPAYFGKTALSENVSYYGLWTPALITKNKSSGRFTENYRKEFNEEPENHIMELCYSSIHILAEAIKRAGTLETTALIAALEQTNYESPLGETISFKPSRVIKHQGLTRLKTLQWQNGVLQVVWPFEFASAPFKYPYKE